MKTELVDRNEALKRANEIHDLAFAIAEASGTLPGFSESQECKIWCALANLATQLKGTEVAIFVNDKPAYQLTDLKITSCSKAVAVLCADNVKETIIENDELIIMFKDNVIEYFEFIEDIEAWKFKRKNVSVKIPYAYPN
jgi:hypothetical protein